MLRVLNSAGKGQNRERNAIVLLRQVALTFALLISSLAFGQSVSSEIAGRVIDPSGAPIYGAVVIVRNLDSDVVFRSVTNEAGMFRFGGLHPGQYRLEVRVEGFQSLLVDRIVLLAAQRWDQTLKLEVAQITQEVAVQAQAESLETVRTHGARGGALTSREASQLPLLQGPRGRLFGQLMLGLGGVYPGRLHAPFMANGNRPVGTLNLMVDSAEFNDVLLGTSMGRGTTEQPVSMETVESFEAQTSSFKAEWGRSSAAVVNLITKSGGDQWRGSLYYLWQNSALNARNALLLEKPRSWSHVPGITLGGPLKRRRVFLFAGYENPVRNTYSGSTTVRTLTADQRARAVPRIRPLVDVYPLPNVPGTNLFVTNVPNPQTLKSVTGRIDAHPSATHRLSYRQTFLKAIGYKFTAIPAASRDSWNGNRLSSLNWDVTPSPRWLQQARLSYSIYQNPVRLENPFFGDPALHGLVGSLQVTGLTPILAFRTNNRVTTHNYGASDDVSVLSGTHLFKTGISLRRIHANTAPETNFYGTMVFRTVEDFLLGRPLSYSLNTGDPRLDLRTWELGLYAQDDWRLIEGLTLNLGIRYEYYAVARDKYGRLGFLSHPDANNFAPRFGFAWDLGARRVVLRGGYGVYYNPFVLNMVGDTRFAPPLVYSYTVANPGLPPNLAAARLGLNRTILDARLRNPFVQNWNLTLERQVFRSAVVSAAYVGSKADHLARSRLPNGGPNLPQPARPDPSQGVITRYESSSSSNYHSLQVTLRGSLPNGMIFRGAYTFAKTIDDASEYAAVPLSETNLRLDRGVSDFHIPHLFNAHVLYPIPWARRHRLFGGWQIGALVTARSGPPFSILSNTNNLSGVLNNRIMNIPGTIIRTGKGRRPLELAPGVTPAALAPPEGMLGTHPRNGQQAPGAFDFNASVSKIFLLTERTRIEVRVESFNLINRVNYEVPVSNIADPLFGWVLTAADPRQFQLSLRVKF